MEDYTDFNWRLWLCDSYDRFLPYLFQKFGLSAQSWTTDSYRKVGNDRDGDPYDYMQEVQILNLKNSENTRKCQFIFESTHDQIICDNSFYLDSDDPQLRKQILDFLKTETFRFNYFGTVDLNLLFQEIEKSFGDYKWRRTDFELEGWHQTKIIRIVLKNDAAKNLILLKVTTTDSEPRQFSDKDVSEYLRSCELAHHSVPSIQKEHQPKCTELGARLVRGLDLLSTIDRALAEHFQLKIDFASQVVE